MKQYRVAYATGSRADYGIVRNYLKLLNQDASIDFSVLVTGSHLEEKFGLTVNEIKKDGFFISAEIPLSIDNSKTSGVIRSMALALDQFGAYFEENRFDLLIVLGDRYEMMALTIAAAMQKIPILHLHGGEVTFGNYDEFIRHSITKMSTYHFTSTEEYKQRVIQLGEDPKRVFCLGALGAENCRNMDPDRVCDSVKPFQKEKYWVVAFHPETLTDTKIEDQISALLSALKEGLGKEEEVIFLGTNADTASDVIRKAVAEYVAAEKRAHYFENLNSDSFLYLVKNSIALIGNSSSGIIETPSLGRYTVNIGDRQKGRVCGDSVVSVSCSKDEILSAMKTVLKKSKEKTAIENPYYQPATAKRYYEKTKEILKENPNALKIFFDLER